jgi:hypothetical protein
MGLAAMSGAAEVNVPDETEMKPKVSWAQADVFADGWRRLLELEKLVERLEDTAYAVRQCSGKSTVLQLCDGTEDQACVDGRVAAAKAALAITKASLLAALDGRPCPEDINGLRGQVTKVRELLANGSRQWFVAKDLAEDLMKVFRDEGWEATLDPAWTVDHQRRDGVDPLRIRVVDAVGVERVVHGARPRLLPRRRALLERWEGLARDAVLRRGPAPRRGPARPRRGRARGHGAGRVARHGGPGAGPGRALRFPVRGGQARPQGDLLEHVERLGKWPTPSTRYCTSDHKRGQIIKALTALAREARAAGVVSDAGVVRVLNCVGLRAEESPGRRRRPALSRDRRASTKRRYVDVWLPIQDWGVERVWEACRASGAPVHPAYAAGLPRASCVLCIYAPEAALQVAGRLHPELLAEYAEVERRIGHTFKRRLPIAKVAADVAAGAAPSGPVASWCM